MKNKVFILLLVACLFCAWAVVSFVLRSRSETKKLQIEGKTNYLAFCFENYYRRYGKLPPPFLKDSSGVPLHSWRTILYVDSKAQAMEEHSDINSYDWKLPWNNPKNIEAIHKSDISSFLARPFEKDAQTCFMAVLTKEGRWYAEICKERWEKDVLLVVYDPEELIPIASPQDITVERLTKKHTEKSTSTLNSQWGIFVNDTTNKIFSRKITAEDVANLNALEKLAGGHNYVRHPFPTPN